MRASRTPTLRPEGSLTRLESLAGLGPIEYGVDHIELCVNRREARGIEWTVLVNVLAYELANVLLLASTHNRVVRRVLRGRAVVSVGVARNHFAIS